MLENSFIDRVKDSFFIKSMILLHLQFINFVVYVIIEIKFKI